MAEEERKPFILNLPQSGPQVVSYIDYIDETTYGAGNLYLKGRARSMDEVKAYLEATLASGSPIEYPPSPDNILSFGRFEHLTRGQFVPDANDPFPHRSQYMLHIHLRVKFYDSFGDIDLGVPWARLYYRHGGFINPDFPLGEFSLGRMITLDDLKLLRCCWIGVEDACFILTELGITNPLVDPTEPTLLVAETGEMLTAFTAGPGFLTADK